MNNYSFEQLPYILKLIEEKLEKILDILTSKDGKKLLEDDFIGAKDASEILKFSLPTLYTKVCKREVPHYKQGNRLYFSRKELLTWIQEGKKKSLKEIKSDAIKITDKIEKRVVHRK